jgi:hypothetical protein
MKPSRLQRPCAAQTKNGDSTKKNGPIKAFVPAQTQESEKGFKNYIHFHRF